MMMAREEYTCVVKTRNIFLATATEWLLRGG